MTARDEKPQRARSEPSISPLSPPAVIIGRQRELTLVLNRHEAAKHGHAHVVLLAGEPGIGKTRLLDEIAARAAHDGAIVLRGGASEAEGMPPYLPFLEALGRYIQETPVDQLRTQVAATSPLLASILPELLTRLGDLTVPHPLPTEQARFRLYEAIGTFLQAIGLSSVLVLLFDDLHWVDTASLDLLCHVARRQSQAHVLIVGAYRDSELEPNAALRRTIADLSRRRMLTEVAVKPLSGQEIEALVTSLLGRPLSPAVSSLLYAQSEGNPFFTEELLRGWIETGALIQQHEQWLAVAPLEQTLPPSLVGALYQRFARFSTALIDDLRVAAIIGRTFDSSLLAAVQQQELEVVEERLLEATHAHLVHADRLGGFTFSHDKIRECLYAEVSASRRRRLHGRIGHLLEERSGQEETRQQVSQLVELAFHFARSDDRERGIDYALRAASQALQTFAPEEALAHYRTALELLKPGDRRRGELLLTLGEVALMAGKDAEAERMYQAAQGWFAQGEQRKALARATYGLGKAYWRQDKRAAARTALEQGLALLGDRPCAEAVEVLIDLSLLLTIYMGQQEEGMASAQQAVEMAQRLGDTQLEERARRIMAENLSLHGEDLVAAVQFLEQALRHTEANGDLSEAAECCLNLAVASYWMADMRRSHEASAQRIALIERCRQSHHLRTTYTWLALLHTSQGRWAEAEQMIERAHPIVDHLPSPMLAAFLHQIHGFLAYQREEYPLAEHELQTATALAEQDRQMGLGMIIWYLGLLGLVQATMGKCEEAHAHMARVEAQLSLLTKGTLPTAPLMMCVALTALVLGEDQHAVALYPKLLAFRGQQYWFLVDRVLGMLASLRSKWETAEKHLTEAQATAQREGLRPEWARTLLERANLELARGGQGSTKRAQELLKQALALFEELGMSHSVQHVRSRLCALSSQPGGLIRPSLPAHLTQREVAVLKSEEAFTAAWAEGRSMSPEQVTDALGPVTMTTPNPRAQPVTRAISPPIFPDELTRREVEVLRLVAQGLSDAQIAEQLVISRRTVNWYLTIIYSKIQVSSRSAATRYAIERQLA